MKPLLLPQTNDPTTDPPATRSGMAVHFRYRSKDRIVAFSVSCGTRTTFSVQQAKTPRIGLPDIVSRLSASFTCKLCLNPAIFELYRFYSDSARWFLASSGPDRLVEAAVQLDRLWGRFHVPGQIVPNLDHGPLAPFPPGNLLHVPKRNGVYPFRLHFRHLTLFCCASNGASLGELLRVS